MFEIDFKRLVALLLPTVLRRPLIFGLLRAGVEAVERVNSEFKSVRAGHVFRLTHNGQVCFTGTSFLCNNSMTLLLLGYIFYTRYLA